MFYYKFEAQRDMKSSKITISDSEKITVENEEVDKGGTNQDDVQIPGTESGGESTWDSVELGKKVWQVVNNPSQLQYAIRLDISEMIENQHITFSNQTIYLIDIQENLKFTENQPALSLYRKNREDDTGKYDTVDNSQGTKYYSFNKLSEEKIQKLLPEQKIKELSDKHHTILGLSITISKEIIEANKDDQYKLDISYYSNK